MVDVRDRLVDFGAIGVFLVTFTEQRNLAGYATEHDLPFPALTDPERAAYRAFGLGRGSVARVWGWKAARRYLEIFRAHGLAGWRRPTEDTLQLGGDFVVDPAGNLAYGYWGDGPDDRPTVDELIDAVRSADTGW